MAAVGTQVGIDLQWRVGAGCHQQRAQFVGEFEGYVGRITFVGTRHRLMHEQDVGITAVAALLATEATHRDDGESRR